MGRLIKYLFYLFILGIVALIGFAYIGPFFGVDFGPITETVTQSVTLNEQ
jgi:hypothetical protein